MLGGGVRGVRGIILPSSPKSVGGVSPILPRFTQVGIHGGDIKSEIYFSDAIWRSCRETGSTLQWPQDNRERKRDELSCKQQYRKSKTSPGNREQQFTQLITCSRLIALVLFNHVYKSVHQKTPLSASYRRRENHVTVIYLFQ